MSVDEEEDEDLLVPEQRLNLLMASPSIIKRRPSMMPVTPNKDVPRLSKQQSPRKNEILSSDDNEDDEEELPLLAIPRLLLRRASTQLGFKAFGIDEDKDDQTNQALKSKEVPDEDFIIEETEEEIEDERIFIEVVDEVPTIEITGINDDTQNVDIEDEESHENPPESDSKKDKMVVMEDTESLERSRESVLFIEAESVCVPSHPRANEPPLEYYPYALTSSKNNILYVVAESLAVPKIIKEEETQDWRESLQAGDRGRGQDCRGRVEADLEARHQQAGV